jgi:hypothetical protein
LGREPVGRQRLDRGVERSRRRGIVVGARARVVREAVAHRRPIIDGAVGRLVSFFTGRAARGLVVAALERRAVIKGVVDSLERRAVVDGRVRGLGGVPLLGGGRAGLVTGICCVRLRC